MFTPAALFLCCLPGFYVAPEGWSCSACFAAKQPCEPSHRDPLLFMPVAKDHYYDQDLFLPHVCACACALFSRPAAAVLSRFLSHPHAAALCPQLSCPLQMLRFLDVFEHVHGPNTKAIVKLDHSTVHLAKDKDALLVQRLIKHDVPLKEGETALRAGWYMVGEQRVEQPMVVGGKKLGIETILKV